MTRTIFLFEDGTALVDGIEADALGDAPDLPFLSEPARISAAKTALANDDWDAAEAASARCVVSASDDKTVTVLFVAPPDWNRFGPTLWDSAVGASHAVFHVATMLVEGVAVTGCVGQSFQDDAARRNCAAWCLRNGLDDIALNVSRTPVGGDGPYCAWPEEDLIDVQSVGGFQNSNPQYKPQAEVIQVSSADGATETEITFPEDQHENVVNLFGTVLCSSE